MIEVFLCVIKYDKTNPVTVGGLGNVVIEIELYFDFRSSLNVASSTRYRIAGNKPDILRLLRTDGMSFSRMILFSRSFLIRTLYPLMSDVRSFQLKKV